MSEEKHGLSSQAFEPVPEGKTYDPYVPASESPAEFTARAAVSGIIFGIVFGAANAYLGLLTGLTISTSIPIAVMTVAAFKAFEKMGKKGSLLEANLAQTTGSASSSLASGLIFTMPALFLWEQDPELLQMVVLALCGGTVGILFMVPLRRFLIVREHGKIPYPEGTACAEVLVASEIGGRRGRLVFSGIGVGLAFKALTDLVRLFPATIKAAVPVIPRAEVGLSANPALLGVGYILGPKIATVMVGGGLLGTVVLVPAVYLWGRELTEPFYPSTDALISDMSPGALRLTYVRYMGAGAVAVAGFITLIKTIPTMIRSFRVGAAEIKERSGGGGADTTARTQRDLPLKVVGIGALIVAAVLTVVPFAFGIDSFLARAVAAVLVVIFAFFFVTVSSRIVGLVGVTSNPTSGMTIATLLGTSTVFWLAGWTGMDGKVAALCVGCVVAIAASIAGDTSQDLKTGFLLGATPKRQQIGELLGVMTSAVFVCFAILILDEVYVLGSDKLAAPQGTLMRLLIDGVIDQSLPWALLGIGAGIAVACELLKIPALPFAVGVYLPVYTMVPVFVGGMIRLLLERNAGSRAGSVRESGILFSSGLVGGVGLMGVGIAGYAFISKSKPDHDVMWTAPWVAALFVIGLIVLMVRAARTDADA